MDTTDNEIILEDSNDKDVKRSQSYPSRSLSYTLNFVDKIYKELGSNDFHSKEDIAKAYSLAVPNPKPKPKKNTKKKGDKK